MGSSYVFENCTDPYESGYTPGASLTVSEARLRLLSADPDHDTTIVRVDIGTGEPAPGMPDNYTIEIFDPVGTHYYTFTGDIVDGDISIEPVVP
jgi:hypothetical protein